ncbi:MAG: hypothetical protein K2X82_05805 [Gemmataceae bacterium]|nr:hypothetical protein [Gemmataceae bacterium]
MKQHKQAQQQQGQVVMAAVAVGYLLPAEIKPQTWTDKFDHGSVRTILYVEKKPVRNAYRVLVANRYSRPDERQWFNADDIPHAIKALQDAEKAHKKARRHLEGGVIRRFIRWLF